MDFNSLMIIAINAVAIMIFSLSVMRKSDSAYKLRARLDHQLSELEKMLIGLEQMQKKMEIKIDDQIEKKFAEASSVLKEIRVIERDTKTLTDTIGQNMDMLRLLERELIANRVLPPK